MGNYDELAAVLPTDYASSLSPKDTQRAIALVKSAVEAGLCEQLGLIPVSVPLVVDAHSGVNDYLDRDGSRTPVAFHIANDGTHTIDAEVVQAATKWKRLALAQFGMEAGEGLLTDMRAIRKDYFLDHDHSAYVDQWDWELAITPEQRTLEFLTDVVGRLWTVLKAAEAAARDAFPVLSAGRYPGLPDAITFMHAEDLLARYPDLPRKERESRILQECGAVFLYGIGWTLADGYPHELRAPDYDDWVTPTTSADGRPMHGLNGDILVWNHVTQRRHELSSMGVRVDGETLKQQLRITGQEAFLDLPYHQAVVEGRVPLSIGGGIGQSRVFMHLLQKAHLGEVSVSVWPQVLKDMCRERNIHVLE
jgi:aspartate--ammonia ligase